VPSALADVHNTRLDRSKARRMRMRPPPAHALPCSRAAQSVHTANAPPARPRPLAAPAGLLA
jgi:hypothetical protein